MRTGLIACLFLVACSSSGAPDMMGDDAPEVDGGIAVPKRGFQLKSPEIEIGPYAEITYCWYFRTPNTESMAINKWVSNMTPGSHHLIMFTTGQTDKQPPGTVSVTNCDAVGGGVNVSNWTYSAQTPDASMTLPSDDGTGTPLALEIPANTAGYIQMHYVNPTATALKAHVTINAEALEAGAAFTKTAAFVTYDGDINVPKGAMAHVEANTCTTPAGAKFWLMSTHAHRRAIKTEVLDGDATIFSSVDWEHPTPETWMSAPFYSFASGKITYRCTYRNDSGTIITDGESALDNEMCMASGYYFPATKSLFCFNNLGPF